MDGYNLAFVIDASTPDEAFCKVQFSVWKFQGFSVIQILREINFGESRSSKNAIFVILGDPEF